MWSSMWSFPFTLSTEMRRGANASLMNVHQVSSLFEGDRMPSPSLLVYTIWVNINLNVESSYLVCTICYLGKHHPRCRCCPLFLSPKTIFKGKRDLRVKSPPPLFWMWYQLHHQKLTLICSHSQQKECWSSFKSSKRLFFTTKNLREIRKGDCERMVPFHSSSQTKEEEILCFCLKLLSPCISHLPNLFHIAHWYHTLSFSECRLRVFISSGSIWCMLLWESEK